MRQELRDFLCPSPPLQKKRGGGSDDTQSCESKQIKEHNNGRSDTNPHNTKANSTLFSIFSAFTKTMATSRFDEQLCELVRQYPLLYDCTHPDYKNRDVIQNSWEEIAGTLKSNALTVAKKWRALRDRSWWNHDYSM